jgi:hypothetical protein
LPNLALGPLEKLIPVGTDSNSCFGLRSALFNSHLSRSYLAKEHASTATLDEGFARDLEEAINSHREPLNPPAWD